MNPAWVRAALTWTVFVVLLSGAGLVAGRPGTAGFVLSGLMLTVGLLCGAALVAARRRASTDDADPDHPER